MSDEISLIGLCLFVAIVPLIVMEIEKRLQ